MTIIVAGSSGHKLLKPKNFDEKIGTAHLSFCFTAQRSSTFLPNSPCEDQPRNINTAKANDQQAKNQNRQLTMMKTPQRIMASTSSDEESSLVLLSKLGKAVWVLFKDEDKGEEEFYRGEIKQVNLKQENDT